MKAPPCLPYALSIILDESLESIMEVWDYAFRPPENWDGVASMPQVAGFLWTTGHVLHATKQPLGTVLRDITFDPSKSYIACLDNGDTELGGQKVTHAVAINKGVIHDYRCGAPWQGSLDTSFFAYRETPYTYEVTFG